MTTPPSHEMRGCSTHGLGSSSHKDGDTGGSYGDYEHGVSDELVRRLQESGLKKADRGRVYAHHAKLSQTAGKADISINKSSSRKNPSLSRVARVLDNAQSRAGSALQDKGAHHSDVFAEGDLHRKVGRTVAKGRQGKRALSARQIAAIKAQGGGKGKKR